MTKEIPLTFKCENEQLIAIVHMPDIPLATGVLIVVGGPQTRVGSHRQFVLLARYLASNGIPVMRFDYRSMGDSSGDNIIFDNVEADISAAIKTFYQQCTGLERVVIWGLCDAASAAMFYSYKDPRVSGMVLLNPWVRTESGKARTYIKHYYIKRLFSVDLWKKILSLRFNIFSSLSSFIKMLSSSLGILNNKKSDTTDDNMSLPDKMAYGLKQFRGRVLIILSGNDYVADEFRDTVKNSKTWDSLLSDRMTEIHSLPEANHTFSRHDWRKNVEKLTYQMLIKCDET